MSGIIGKSNLHSGLLGSIGGGQVVYQYGHNTNADGNSAMNGNWQVVTHATITVPSSIVSICSRISVFWAAHALIYKGSSHHFCGFRMYRSSPSATQIGQKINTGANNHTSHQPFYGAYSLLVTDLSLVPGSDHVYRVEKMSNAVYAGDVSGAQDGGCISVWGIK